MALSKDVMSQFAKAMVPKQESKEATLNATYKKIDGKEYVQLDGSDILTPVTSSVVAETDDRVKVIIKNHAATVIGNITSPSARNKDLNTLKDTVDENGNTIKRMDTVIQQQQTSINQIDTKINQHDVLINQHDTVINQQGDQIVSINNTIISQGNSIEANHNAIIAQGNEIDIMNDTITSHGNSITSMNNTIQQHGNKIDQNSNTISQQGNSITEMNSDITILNSGFTIKDGVITGLSKAVVDNLETNNLNAHYAQIDFANIKMEAVGKLFSDSGIIKDLIVGDQSITGELVGVTIKGDLIEANSLKADRLVVRGEDGLYYKLNIDSLGQATVDSDTKYQNGLDGSVIVANSIVAEKIAVDDLVAFGATIGGFNIDTHSLHTHLKDSIDSSASGMFMDDTGQLVFGDGNNFIKYFKDTNNQWKLVIRSNQISMSSSSKTIQEEFDELESNTIKNVDVLYALGDSSTQAPTTGWSTTAPQWQSGKYMWQKTVTTLGDNTSKESDPTCITGAKGQDGSPGTPGAPGTSIENVDVFYYLSTSNQSLIDGSWSTTAPVWTQGKYIWSKERVYYSDGTSSESAPACISGQKGDTGEKGETGEQGPQGPQGIQGIQGPKGDNGESYYTWIKYADSPTSGMSDNPTGKAYIGLAYNKSTPTESTSYSDYSWSLIKGADGAKGDTGPKGETGATGNGIGSINYYYARTTTQTAPAASSITSTTIPTLDATNKYLWQKEVITYTATSTPQTTVLLIAVYGDTGKQGPQGPKGTQGPQGPAGSDGTVKSATAPTDTNKLWLDLNDGKLKQYQMNAGGTTGSWVVVNDYSDTTSDLNARLAELTDSLNSQLDALNTIVVELREHTDTSFEQTSDSFNLKFTQMQETITQTIDGLQTHIQEQEEYIRFRNGTITLGVVGNLYTLYLDNDEIVINYNGTEVSRWKQSTFQAKELRLKDASWGYAFVWMPRPNGSYSLRKVVD